MASSSDSTGKTVAFHHVVIVNRLMFREFGKDIGYGNIFTAAPGLRGTVCLRTDEKAESHLLTDIVRKERLFSFFWDCVFPVFVLRAVFHYKPDRAGSNSRTVTLPFSVSDTPV